MHAKKYDPKFCDFIIEEGKKGKYVSQWASALNVTRAAIYKWAKEHPDFGHAFELARTHNQAHYEEIGYRGMIGEYKHFRDHIWLKLMQARFKEDYADVQTIESRSDNKLDVTVTIKK